jgi:galactosylgalactosylxylosylprotein 3-beta-glucuronosyltransferase 3
MKEKLNEFKYFDKFYSLKYISNFSNKYSHMPFIYVITPTIKKQTQIPDLIRLKNTLQSVPKVIWILVEDSENKTKSIKLFLAKSNLNFVHLNTPSINFKNIQNNKSSGVRHKGVEQRNLGINWLRKNQNKIDLNAVVFFADDDNTYDTRLFEEVTFKYFYY